MGVYFYEVEIVVWVGDEFYCFGIDVVYCVCGIDRGFVYCSMMFGVYVWGGCFF